MNQPEYMVQSERISLPLDLIDHIRRQLTMVEVDLVVLSREDKSLGPFCTRIAECLHEVRSSLVSELELQD